MSLKRRYDEFNGVNDDTDDEDISPGKQILPVAKLPADFDGDPEDGLEYLFLVRRDAKKLPFVTRVSNPYQSPTRALPATTLTASPSSSLPSFQWREVCGSRFKHFKNNLRQTDIDLSSPLLKSMPAKKERDHWWAFLSGKPDAEWNPPKRPKSEPSSKFGGMRGFDPYVADMEVDTVLRYDIEDSLSAASTATSPREPVPSIIQSIDERMALHLLMYFAHWINQHLSKPDLPYEPTESHARWIFALLTRLDDELSADDMNLLRNLARAVLDFLKTRHQETMVEASELSTDVEGKDSDQRMSQRSCWIVLTIIIDGWKQRDLWLETENALRSVTTLERNPTRA
ncbi:survival motor neuron interacting protein 1-domain-containing protein [Flagelloscypha sp. PMI_526]|nr:survival motor neuron interacting protein 1-domain-containing protein [Flagelloscypha sp. PMI_526]